MSVALIAFRRPTTRLKGQQDKYKQQKLPYGFLIAVVNVRKKAYDIFFVDDTETIVNQT